MIFFFFNFRSFATDSSHSLSRASLLVVDSLTETAQFAVDTFLTLVAVLANQNLRKLLATLGLLLRSTTVRPGTGSVVWIGVKDVLLISICLKSQLKR